MIDVVNRNCGNFVVSCKVSLSRLERGRNLSLLSRAREEGRALEVGFYELFYNVPYHCTNCPTTWNTTLSLYKYMSNVQYVTCRELINGRK